MTVLLFALPSRFRAFAFAFPPLRSGRDRISAVVDTMVADALAEWGGGEVRLGHQDGDAQPAGGPGDGEDLLDGLLAPSGPQIR